MLTIFTTGGTFDKIYFDANSEFSIEEPQAETILQQANVTSNYIIEPLLRKDSLEITDADRQHICAAVVASNSQHIIIIHGTDTMAKTAQALASCTLTDKTVVLVGAMQPARMQASDATFNLGFATAAVQLLSPSVYIAMNGQVFDHDNVVKNLAAGRFESL